MLCNPALPYEDQQFCSDTVIGFGRVLSRLVQPQRSDGTGADVIRAEDILARASVGKKYPVWKFCRNNAPLSAVVQFEEGHWFAELEWLNVVGEGVSPQAALSDLESHIEYFADLYQQKSPDELTPFAAELKNRFAQLVRA